MKTYKFLENGKSYHGGSCTWSLPVKNEDGSWTPGEWTEPVEGEVVLCENGYHLCRAQDLVYWPGPELYEAEYEGDMVSDDEPPETKIAVRRARLTRRVETWNEKTARLFAVWCARQALKLVDTPDPRSVTAVDVAERYANGEATGEELAAAGAAAWDAAWAAARDAYADWYAAKAAARAADWYARYAGAAEGAAWYAARAADWYVAGAASRAAGYAGAAAWATARAAGAAAEAAAWAAQTKKLLEMLGEQAG
jgi:hypothetical protein